MLGYKIWEYPKEKEPWIGKKETLVSPKRNKYFSENGSG